MKIKIKYFIFLVFTCLFLTSCGLRMSEINQINIVNTENNEKNIVTNDSKTANLIVKAINNKDKTDEDINKYFYMRY